MLALGRRVDLQKAFPGLACPYHEEQYYPYGTTYRSLHRSIAQSRDAIREFLRKALPSRLSWTEAERVARRADYAHGKPPEIYSPFLDTSARFLIGTLGGCCLILPMLIMVLRPSLVKSLVTVSVAVVLFALVLSLVFETDNRDTITATATYAAVLVVFVGSSGGAVAS